MPAHSRPRHGKVVRARRDSGAGTTWTKIAAILTLVAAVLNLGSAALHALPTSPSPTLVIVIRTSVGQTLPAGRSSDAPRHGRSGHCMAWMRVSGSYPRVVSFAISPGQVVFYGTRT